MYTQRVFMWEQFLGMAHRPPRSSYSFPSMKCFQPSKTSSIWYVIFKYLLITRVVDIMQQHLSLKYRVCFVIMHNPLDNDDRDEERANEHPSMPGLRWREFLNEWKQLLFVLFAFKCCIITNSLSLTFGKQTSTPHTYMKTKAKPCRIKG